MKDGEGRITAKILEEAKEWYPMQEIKKNEGLTLSEIAADEDILEFSQPKKEEYED